MCLAIPMRIRAIRPDGMAIGDLDGAEREIDLSLIAEPRVGDYVIVHTGYAIEKLDEKEADERLALFKELAASWEGPANEVS
jgi:hydrogenase expression/formation protein HypC